MYQLSLFGPARRSNRVGLAVSRAQLCLDMWRSQAGQFVCLTRHIVPYNYLRGPCVVVVLLLGQVGYY